MVPGLLTINYYTFIDGEYDRVGQQIDASEHEFVEDIIIHLCKTRLSIGPVARHLFGLYCPSLKVWLAPNQLLKSLDIKRFRELVLMIRFRPTDPKNLARIDRQAFDYYFCQMRATFLNSCVSEMDDRLLGVIIMNVLIHIIEKNLSIEKPLEFLKLQDFFPLHPFMKKFAKSYQRQETKSVEFVRFLREGYYRALSNDEDLIPADFVKAEFITSLLSHEEYEAPAIEELGQEIFPLTVISEKGDYEVKLRFRPQYLDLSLYSVKIWERICFLHDLDGISFTGDYIEIERKDDKTIRAKCDNFIGKSLCALLEGYYRLTVNSEHFICKYVTPPSIEMMRKNHCHGPIGYENAVKKLNREGSGWGTYLIRMNEKEYVYNIHVLVREGVDTLTVEPIVENSKREYFVQEYEKTFRSLLEIREDLKLSTCDGEALLRDCIKPKDCDIIADLPLFKNSSKQTPNGSVKEDIISHRTDFLPQLKNSNRVGCDGSFSCYKISYKGEQKIRKVLDKTTVTERFEFLLKAEQWKNFRTELLVHVIDFTIENSSIIIDYFPHGTLDLYLQKNRETLSIFNLLECATYLSKAVKYLHDRRITHGSIRCRTLYVVEHPPQPFRLKLGDPFININHNEDRLWIAPEYHSCSDIVPTSIDIWATATTLWEIFSYGSKPPGREVHYLNCPLSCPYDFWTIIQKCWSPKPEERVSPAYIHQHIQDLIIQEYQVENSTPRNSQNFGRETGWGVRLRLPRFLRPRPRSDRFSGLFSLRGSDSNMENSESDSDEETWIIPSSRLSISIVNNCEEILGKGNYGEVIKARYPGWSDSYVAVKRINNRYKQKPGVLGDMIREFEIMTELDHQNIVSVVGIVKEPEIMLVMEFMPMGSLVKYLRNFEKERKDVGRINSVKYALDIVNGMQYLESRKILHRDLAARNILMAREDLVKLADFGLAQSLGPDEETYLVKTPRYLPFRWYAPESIKAPPEFSHKSDVWSFGVTLWEILSLGEMPKFPTIDNNSPQQLLNHLLSGKRLPYPEKSVLNTDRLWPIAQSCWIIEQDLRPSFSELKGRIQAIFDEL